MFFRLSPVGKISFNRIAHCSFWTEQWVLTPGARLRDVHGEKPALRAEYAEFRTFAAVSIPHRVEGVGSDLPRLWLQSSLVYHTNIENPTDKVNPANPANA